MTGPSTGEERDAATPVTIEQRLVLRAERLEPVTRRVQGRLAHISRRAVTVRTTIEVDVLHEELVVEYVDGDGSPMPDDFTTNAEPFVIVLRKEEVEIVKHVVPMEEVHIGKRRITENRHISETLRRETLLVDDIS